MEDQTLEKGSDAHFEVSQEPADHCSSDRPEAPERTLKRQLKSRHISMIRLASC